MEVMIMKIKILQLTCLRCNWKWMPRTTDVRSCPKCHSPKWDVAKVEKKDESKKSKLLAELEVDKC